MAMIERQKSSGDWYNNKKFWRLFAPFMFGEDTWKKTDFEAASIMKLLELKKGDMVLDTFCGVGRHSVAFSQLGLRVTGIDKNEEYLDAAREFAKAENVSPIFIESDILAYMEKDLFDAVTNLGTSFGFFSSRNEDLLFLTNMHSCLKKTGKLIIETVGKETVALKFKESEWYEQDGNYILARYETSEDWTKFVNRWIVVGEDGTFDYTFNLRLYSAAELKELALEAGFKKIRVFGDLNGNPYDHRADSLVLIADK